MNFYIHTLGCKVNYADSEKIAGCLCEAGLKRSDDMAESALIIINTCAVTAESERKSRNMIRRMRTDNPGAVIAACGCWSRVGKNRESVGEADMIIAKNRPEDTAQEIIDYLKAKNLMGETNAPVKKAYGIYYESKTRAAIKIQDGCNRYCTYCIIPYARGEMSSESIEQIAADAKALAEKGFKEVVLTGIHIASYLWEGYRLIDVMEKVAQSGIDRIRLGSLEPIIMDEAFALRASALSNRLCPHFHLSLQSGSNNILKKMNRRYTAEEYIRSCEVIYKHFKNPCITTDIIVGFPGETREDFEASMEMVERAGFAHVHVFPYSPRQGTPAAKMPGQLTGAQKHELVEEMMECCKRVGADLRADMIGKTLTVLPECINSKGNYEGYSENYLRCEFASPNDVINSLTPVVITSLRDDMLVGSLAD